MQEGLGHYIPDVAAGHRVEIDAPSATATHAATPDWMKTRCRLHDRMQIILATLFKQ